MINYAILMGLGLTLSTSVLTIPDEKWHVQLLAFKDRGDKPVVTVFGAGATLTEAEDNAWSRLGTLLQVTAPDAEVASTAWERGGTLVTAEVTVAATETKRRNRRPKTETTPIVEVAPEPESLPVIEESEPLEISPLGDWDDNPVSEAEASPEPEPALVVPFSNADSADLKVYTLIGDEINRIGWTKKQASAYLLKTYNKRTRAELTPEESVEVAAYLATLPEKAELSAASF